MKFPKNANLWLPSYMAGRLRRLVSGVKPKRVWVALTDHYEPMGGKVSLPVGRERVAVWQRRWPEIAAAAPCDATGRGPCFTAFYPQEEYERPLLDRWPR